MSVSVLSSIRDGYRLLSRVQNGREKKKLRSCHRQPINPRARLTSLPGVCVASLPRASDDDNSCSSEIEREREEKVIFSFCSFLSLKHPPSVDQC